MSDCQFCQLMNQKVLTLFEDEHIVAMLHPTPTAAGHIIVMPKEHAPILENVPDFVVASMFVKANELSGILFESLNMMGTNVILQNGEAAGQKFTHAMLHVIPRAENDGLNFQWQPRTVDEESMSKVELMLKEEAGKIGDFEKEKAKPVELEDTETISEDSEDERIKQLRRIP